MEPEPVAPEPYAPDPEVPEPEVPDPVVPDPVVPDPVVLEPVPLLPGERESCWRNCTMQRSLAEPVMASQVSLVMSAPLLLPVPGEAEEPGAPMPPVLPVLPVLPLDEPIPDPLLAPWLVDPAGAPVCATAMLMAEHPMAAAMMADFSLNMVFLSLRVMDWNGYAGVAALTQSAD